MNNLKISTRLIILIGLLSALLIAIGGIGLFGISQSNDAPGRYSAAVSASASGHSAGK
jgi:hypothetical protein